MADQTGGIFDYITSVEMFGSNLNGLALRGNSDLDISVNYESYDGDY